MKATLFQSAADTSNFDKYPRDEAVPADELSGWDKEFWIYTRGSSIYTSDQIHNNYTLCALSVCRGHTVCREGDGYWHYGASEGS